MSWGIDHIKVDDCEGFDEPHMNASYAIIGSFLQEAVKARGAGPVVYHPSNLGFEFPRQFRELAAIGNQWRFQTDVQDSWESVAGIIQAIGAGQPTCIPGPLPVNCTGRLRGAESVWCASFCVERDEFLRVPGRGGWHDPDMLLVGETPCSEAATKAGMQCSVLPLEEQKTQMAIWSMASAPLLLSADLTNVSNASMAILTNPDVLRIDQDALGRMPLRFYANSTVGADVWRKDLVGGDVAVAIVNMGKLPPPVGAPVRWIQTPGKIYSNTACVNLNGAHLASCDNLKGPEVVTCCKNICLGDPRCTAINVNIEQSRCVKHGCGDDIVSAPDWVDPGWDSYHHRPSGELPPGFSFKLSDVGFAFNTRVAVRDVFGGENLGVHVGTFTTTRAIPLHGVLLLWLSYSPQYPPQLRRSEL